MPHVHARVNVIGDVNVRLDGLSDIDLHRYTDIDLQGARDFHVQRVGDLESRAPDGQHSQLPMASFGRGSNAHAVFDDVGPVGIEHSS